MLFGQWLKAETVVVQYPAAKTDLQFYLVMKRPQDIVGLTSVLVELVYWRMARLYSTVESPTV